MNIPLKAARKIQKPRSWRGFPLGILAAMKKERGYTLIETLVALTLVLILSASGLYGWRNWQQSQRLWQTASELRDFLAAMRSDANWQNHDRRFRVNRHAVAWCLVADDTVLDGCPAGNPAVYRSQWAEVELTKITPNLAFFGLRNTAWAGSITLESEVGSWTILISSWGRVRLCEGATC